MFLLRPPFFFAFIKWLTRRPRSWGRTKGPRDDIFFLCPARFSRPLRNIARQLYQTRPNCDISPPSPSSPLALRYPIAPSSLFFYSHFPATYARRFFFIAHAGNLFGWSFFRELVIKIVTPTNCVRRTRFVRSIARVTRLTDNVRQRKWRQVREIVLYFFSSPGSPVPFAPEEYRRRRFFTHAATLFPNGPFYYDWEKLGLLDIYRLL